MLVQDNRDIHPGEFYRHFKKKDYQIVAIASHSETKEKYVVYQALYGDFGVYVRPYDMFMSEVDHIKYPDVEQKYRFEKIEMNNNDIVQEQPELNTTDVKIEGEVTNSYLMEFFDKDTYKDKIEYLSSIRAKIDDKMINDVAVSLDVTVDDGDIETRINSLMSCLKMRAKFECSRLR